MSGNRNEDKKIVRRFPFHSVWFTHPTNLLVTKVLLSWYIYFAFFNEISIGNIKNHIIPIICVVACTIDGSTFTAQSQNDKNQTKYSCCHLWNHIKVFYIRLLQIAESEASESNGLNLPSWKLSRNGILLSKLFWPILRNKCSIDREELFKFEAVGREFEKNLRSLKQFIGTVKGQNNLW